MARDATATSPVAGAMHSQRQSPVESDVVTGSMQRCAPLPSQANPFPSPLSAHSGHTTEHSSSTHTAGPCAPSVFVVAGSEQRHSQSSVEPASGFGSKQCCPARHLSLWSTHSPTGSVGVGVGVKVAIW